MEVLNIDPVMPSICSRTLKLKFKHIYRGTIFRLPWDLNPDRCQAFNHLTTLTLNISFNSVHLSQFLRSFLIFLLPY